MSDENVDARIRTLVGRTRIDLEPDRAVSHVRVLVDLHAADRKRRLRLITTAGLVAVVVTAVLVPLVLSGSSNSGGKPSGLVPTSGKPSACTTSSPTLGGVVPSATGPTSGAQPSTSVSLQGATATYTAALNGSPPRVLGYPGRLTVSAAGHRWTLPAPSAAGLAGNPNPNFVVLGSLCLVEFSTVPSPYPAVLLQGYSGFAHCCFDPTLYTFDPTTARYVVTEHITPNSPGVHFDHNAEVSLVDDNGAALLVNDDGRFPYALGCFACTPGPVRAYTLERGRLVDVTARHPALVEAQLATLATTLANPPNAGYVNGPSAAWEADRCTLGQGRSGWAQVEQWNDAPSVADAYGNYTTAQIAGFLLANGYCVGQIPTPPAGAATTTG